MGAVCAIVYLLLLIVFIPFAFYKDIVAATSGGGNRDVVIEVHHIETGRFLHRFPHNKVGNLNLWLAAESLLTPGSAGFVSVRTAVTAGHRHPRHRR